jgi:hypothetical protein
VKHTFAVVALIALGSSHGFAGIETIEIRPVHARALCGQVLDPIGGPIPHAVVRLYHDKEHEALIRTVETDQRGEFCFPSYGDGEYWLVVTSYGFNPLAGKVIIGRRGPHRFRVKMVVAT